MNRLDANSSPAHIARLLAAARHNAEKLAAIDDSDPATLPLGMSGASTSGAVSIPGYQLVCEIHRGGQGVVFQAIHESTQHDVAIKVLHDRRAASPRELERFEREAAVLRDLNHPNLIAVSEVGIVDGRPYLVMPYIPGWPLDEHVRRNGLSVRETLVLFLKVCDAVNVAHLNGVIHRDLKPSNIRVDDAGEPHVLDFGLAKTTAASSGNSLTETGQFVGSMPWASPEQAEPGLGRVDVRTDVYSLGAVLYQLLTSRLPIDPIGSQREVLNRIVTDEPQSPRLLRREIDDEIETIVLKCLSKDRARRYSNADGLAADIRRYLAGEAIEAKRDSVVYVARKLIRKHRGLVAAIGLVLLVGAVGGTTSFFLWRKAKHESRQASNARDAESDQRARAAAVSGFLAEMLTAADPAYTKGEKVTVREALDRAAKRIEDGALREQPVVEADVRYTIGSTYFGLGLFTQAEAQLRAADALQTQALGNEHRDTLRTRFKIAETLTWVSDYLGAAVLAQATLEAQRRVLGQDDVETLRTTVLLGRVLWAQPGRFFEAESLLRFAVERLERLRGPNHQDTADAKDWLGELYAFNSYGEKAEPLHREALRIHTQVLGAEHPVTLNSMNLLAIALDSQARHEEAEAINRETYELRLRVLGPDHIDTLISQANMALAMARQGRYAEAEPIHRENLAALLRTVGPDHIAMMSGKRFLADCLTDQGKYAEAETLLREALEVAVRKYGPEEADTSIRLMCELASVLVRQNKDAEAEKVARQVLEFQRRQVPRAEPGEFALSSNSLIQVLNRRGATEEALRIEKDLIEFSLAAARAPDASAKIMDVAARRLLDSTRESLRDAPQALSLALQANQKSNRKNPHFLRTLAKAYLRTGDATRASQSWEQAIPLLASDQARARMFDAAAHDLLTVIPESLRDGAQAVTLALKANDLSRYEKPDQLDTLALAYHRTGKTEKAIELQKKAITLLAADASNRAEYERQLADFERSLEPRSQQDEP